MKALKQHVHGRIVSVRDQAGLWLTEHAPASESADSIFLRYAYTFQGPKDAILPAFLLDDWGTEIKGLDLYEWVRKFGDQFPRAELFGFDLHGGETQCFLRELDLYARLLCYAYPTKDQPISDGIRVEAILIPDPTVSTPVVGKPPPSSSRPLRSVNARWWLVNPSTRDLGPIFA